MRQARKSTQEHHQLILDKSAMLFRERGFSGVSVAELMQAAGLTHGGFYAHFDSKDALLQASLEHAMASGEDVRASLQRSEQPRKRFIDHYLSPTHRDNPGNGCAIAALAAEVARNPLLPESFTPLLEATIERLHGQFERQGEIERGRVLLILSAVVGALSLARATRGELSDQLLREVRQQLLALVETDAA